MWNLYKNRFIFFIVICSFNAYADSPFIAKKMELTHVTGQIQRLQKKISLDKQQQSGLEQQLKQSELTIGKVSEHIKTYHDSILQEQKKLSELKSTQQHSIIKMNKQYQALAEYTRGAFKLTQIHPLKIILNQEDICSLQRHLRYYHYLSQTRLELIETIQEFLDKIKINMQKMDRHQQNLKILLLQNKQQQKQLQQAQAHRQELLLQLNQRVQDKQQQLSTLLANQKALQEIITHLRISVNEGITGMSFHALQGKLDWPIKGSITGRYGSSMEVGDQHLSGVIIKAAQGTPVKVIAEGKVIFASWLRGFGLLIIINHGNNFMSLYARNHALYAKNGDHVNRGDIIASIGNSGGFDNTALYFEIRHNGVPQNPGIWCH